MKPLDSVPSWTTGKKHYGGTGQGTIKMIKGRETLGGLEHLECSYVLICKRVMSEFCFT